jgi:hypothetical protein
MELRDLKSQFSVVMSTFEGEQQTISESLKGVNVRITHVVGGMEKNIEDLQARVWEELDTVTAQLDFGSYEASMKE